MKERGIVSVINFIDKCLGPYLSLRRTNFIKQKCIYCNKGSTKKDPVMFTVRTCGQYWQHWDFKKKKGCDKNKENISPSGE